MQQQHDFTWTQIESKVSIDCDHWICPCGGSHTAGLYGCQKQSGQANEEGTYPGDFLTPFWCRKYSPLSENFQCPLKAASMSCAVLWGWSLGFAFKTIHPQKVVGRVFSVCGVSREDHNGCAMHAAGSVASSAADYYYYYTCVCHSSFRDPPPSIPSKCFAWEATHELCRLRSLSCWHMPAHTWHYVGKQWAVVLVSLYSSRVHAYTTPYWSHNLFQNFVWMETEHLSYYVMVWMAQRRS